MHFCWFERASERVCACAACFHSIPFGCLIILEDWITISILLSILVSPISRTYEPILYRSVNRREEKLKSSMARLLKLTTYWMPIVCVPNIDHHWTRAFFATFEYLTDSLKCMHAPRRFIEIHSMAYSQFIHLVTHIIFSLLLTVLTAQWVCEYVSACTCFRFFYDHSILSSCLCFTAVGIIMLLLFFSFLFIVRPVLKRWSRKKEEKKHKRNLTRNEN